MVRTGFVSGEDVQVVAGVAVGDGEGVIALGHQQQVAVADVYASSIRPSAV